MAQLNITLNQERNTSPSFKRSRWSFPAAAPGMPEQGPFGRVHRTAWCPAL